ncbi:intron-binding protein aquarius-like, partial [Trifolium medium]|nr:intron-binding protein aquarius-like [Trifolium medium]
VDTDMPEKDDKPSESSEATNVNNHVAGDIPPERSMEDGTVVE